jgi:hypothetical protein
MTEEQKEKISNTKKGTSAWNKGISCTKETKQKISENNIKRWKSIKSKEK